MSDEPWTPSPEALQEWGEDAAAFQRWFDGLTEQQRTAYFGGLSDDSR